MQLTTATILPHLSTALGCAFGLLGNLNGALRLGRLIEDPLAEKRRVAMPVEEERRQPVWGRGAALSDVIARCGAKVTLKGCVGVCI